MEGILPKLPVKSLVRFKCVSKSWKTLFKTPSFVSKQWLASSINYKYNPLLLFYKIEASHPSSHRLKLHSSGNPSPNLYKPFADDNVHRIYGPCNGIFCIRCLEADLIIWNPATREVKLPPPPLCPPSDEHYTPAYGFSIDPKTNYYKIVKLLFVEKYYTDYEELALAEVYNLTTDCWRIINDIVPARYIAPVRFNSYAIGLIARWLKMDVSRQSFALI